MLSEIELGRLPDWMQREYPRAVAAEMMYYVDSIELAAQLAEENERLTAAIKQHHSQRADDRCWLDDDNLYAAAGLPLVDRSVGNKAHMLENCRRFIAQRCDGGGPWKSYIELEAENERLRRKLAEANSPVWDGRNSEELNE